MLLRWIRLIAGWLIFGLVVVGGAWLWRVSQQPPPNVPNLLGLDFATAQSQVHEGGWVLDTVTVRQAGSINNEVVLSTPPAGTALAKGEKLQLVVSLGEELVMVPNLANTTLLTAQATLETAGLVLGELTFVTNEAVPHDVVLRSDLPVGVRAVELGSAVDLLVSSGPTSQDHDH